MLNIFYPAVLSLDDGSIYKGWSFFKSFTSYGEIVFNTGMTGYQEIVTDPSYSGQMVVFTYPEIGNTGLNHIDSESNFIHVKGIIAKNICLQPSNWRATTSIKEYILNKQIPHIFGLDTRALTRRLRMKGVMTGYISNKVLVVDNWNLLKKIVNLDLVKRVTTSNIFHLNHKNNYSFNPLTYLNCRTGQKKMLYKGICIVLINFGVKNNIIRRLLSYGCNIYILPATTNYTEIFKYKPDGIILSNGPGNPSNVSYSIDTIKKIIYYSNIPIFGICMGHQLLSLALGASTFKLKFGHRGLNHPSGLNQYSEITSQNHGFAVSLDNMIKNSILKNNSIRITHLNLNDLTIGGILHNNKPIFSVQYHPEASPGPHDSDYLFKCFIELISLIKFNKNM
uniref:Carbamoyl phosphate synthase small chain n=1 Tax=Membranoptera platyphylla TaxID=1204437 RepID=A0A1I9KQF1_9FLOR|nr:carbamoyl-phosphate synthase small chain [Membranoptera platyphylla]AMJ16855.1 carbamoyl-phosphate synthase small chain [Membranoptera platyphylla]